MLSHHSIRAVGVAGLALAGGLATAMPGAILAQQPATSPAATSTSSATSSSFTIFIRGVPVGSEQISVERSADGWTINSTGRIGAPLDIVTRKLQVRYDLDWKPLELTVDATTRGQVTTLHTIVTGTTARSDMNTSGAPSEKTDTIDGAAVLLPNLFFAPYEALAARLGTAEAGSTLAAYIVPLGSMTVTVGAPTSEQIQTLARVVTARRTPITLTMPTAPPLDAEVWGDESGRLLRVSVPAQSLEVVREDIASVSSRRIAVSRAGDEQIRIPGNGFSLAGTVSKPAGAGARPMPAVVLAGGSGASDRDETVFGIPIFGQLAGTLADAGFIVLRYDKRGVGQSGGRPESATLDDYAEDLRAAVKVMTDRKDVDRRRVAVVGHSEGGALAMIAASKDDRIAAIALVASIGVTGAELNLAQVTHALERSNRTEAEKQAAIDLQKTIQNAVLTGAGWEGISPEVRRQADTAWFQSFLAFDPARIMRNIDQPVLIVQGLLDTQVAPSNADRLEALARARRRGSVEAVRLPGINHLLVPATTGEADEYGTLKDRRVSPAVSNAIAGWLKKVFAAPR
jgi:pimeloyl-ACP methyl ester carboxylesterase